MDGWVEQTKKARGEQETNVWCCLFCKIIVYIRYFNVIKLLYMRGQVGMDELDRTVGDVTKLPALPTVI